MLLFACLMCYNTCLTGDTTLCAQEAGREIKILTITRHCKHLPFNLILRCGNQTPIVIQLYLGHIMCISYCQSHILVAAGCAACKSVLKIVLQIEFRPCQYPQ